MGIEVCLRQVWHQMVLLILPLLKILPHLGKLLAKFGLSDVLERAQDMFGELLLYNKKRSCSTADSARRAGASASIDSARIWTRACTWRP